MTSVVSRVSRAKAVELISFLEEDKLSKNELEGFIRFMNASSVLCTGLVDGQLLCLWGLVPPTLLSNQAYLWLYTTEAAKEHEFILVRRSQIEVKKMLLEFPRIVGHCEVEATNSIRWLGWLGASFGKPDNGLIPFVIRSKDD